MAITNFAPLSEKQKNMWARSIVDQMTVAQKRNSFKHCSLAKAGQPPNPVIGVDMSKESPLGINCNDMPKGHFDAIMSMRPPVTAGDLRACLAGKASRDPRLDKYTVERKAAPVSYDNEVRARHIDDNPVCGMGMKPGGGQNQDGWVEVPDVIYPLLGLFRHDDGYKLECIASHAQTIWRVLEPGGTIISQRTDLAQEANQAAKTWASFRVADHLKMLQCYKDNQTDGTDEDTDQGPDFDHFEQYKIKRGDCRLKFEQNRESLQWDPKLLNRFAKCPQKFVINKIDMEGSEKSLMKYFQDRIDDSMFDALVSMNPPEGTQTGRFQAGGIPCGSMSPEEAYKLIANGTCTVAVDPAKSEDLTATEIKERLVHGRGDAITTAMAIGTRIHQEIDRSIRKRANLAVSYGMGKKGLGSIATNADMGTDKLACLIEAYKEQDVSGRVESRRGQPWGKKEEQDLKIAHEAGRDMERIARFHGRTRGAIGSRLEKLGLVNYVDGEFVNKLDGLVRDKHGAMATLQIKTRSHQITSAPKKEFGVIAIEPRIETLEYHVPNLSQKGIDVHTPIRGTKVDMIIMDDPCEDEPGLRSQLKFIGEDGPKELVAIPSPAMFESDKTYVLIHREAAERFSEQHVFPIPDYLEDLEAMQDKFYEVKETVPQYRDYGKEPVGDKFVMLNGMVIADGCVQAKYKTPREGGVYLSRP